MAKTILITGSSSGIGKRTVIKFLKEGWNVVATMRKPEKEQELKEKDNLMLHKLDVTNISTIQQSIKKSIEVFGQLDVVVNNAGYGLMGPLELTNREQLQKQMDVNFFGLIDVIKETLPYLRKQKQGTIINVSSIGGRIALPYFSPYLASKFAVEGLSESLQYELIKHNIYVKLIEPGAYNTQFTTSLEMAQSKITNDYNEDFGKFAAKLREMATKAQNPDEVANKIFEAATDGKNTLRYPVGQDAMQWVNARKNMTDKELFSMIKEQF